MNIPRDTSLVAPIAAHAEREPQRQALVLVTEDGSHTPITAGELHDDALAAAHALAARGLGAGDVTIVIVGHSRALVATLLGALYLGAVPCVYAYPTERMDPAAHAERIRAVLAIAAARALLTTPALAAALTPLLAGSGCTVLDATTLTAEGGPRTSPALPDPQAPAFLQFTSGTTRLPRGIAHTHARVLGYLAARARNDRFRPGDVVVSWLPLYHDLGLVSGLITPLVLGLPTVLISPLHWARDPKQLPLAVHRHRGTHAWMPNFALNHCARLVRDADLAGVDLSCWRALVLGGEPVRLASMRAFVGRFAPYGFRETALMAGYGMAETVEGGSATMQGRMPAVDWVWSAELTGAGRAVPAPPESPGATPIVSCGPPLDGTDIRIVEADGRPLPERRVGEITVRSDYMMTGYHRQPELTAEVIRDGWLYTGDLGYLVAGELFVCGRKKDVIIVAGRNVQPHDVEAIADAVPGIRPGRSVAFGVDDPRAGSERIVVVCEPSASDADPLALERELRRRVAHELDLALGDVRFVAPGWVVKTSSGKLARDANREKYRRDIDAPR
jgi:acyl-CoA synthetase (AMP-forming)/AMP-acid ligase II